MSHRRSLGPRRRLPLGHARALRAPAWRAARVAPLAAAGALLAAALWWRRHPSACPYGQRFWVELPHPFITRGRLREVLEPQPGERVLEVGPGTGYYSLGVAWRGVAWRGVAWRGVARWLAPGGTLEILDLQSEMLDHTMRRARERGIENIQPTRGDAQALPYPDGSFDAAYLNVTLGELPDQAAALRELARVLKREGRLVVGEILGDPHWVPLGTLRARAEVAGLTLERRLGGPLGYYARFRPDGHRRGGDDRLNLQRLNPQGAAGGLPGVGAP